MVELVGQAHTQMSPERREALWRRGVSDEQIDSLQIGILGGARLPEGIDYPTRFASWWASHRGQFQNPLVFPLTSTMGVILGLQFRDIDRKIKGYMDYFESKEEPAFFGLYQAMPSIWETEVVWLAEGVFDVCPIQRHVPNIISTMHAGVSNQLKRVLRRVARTLVIAYDMDSTGRKVSYEIARELKDQFEIKIVKFPRVPLSSGHGAKDPNDLWSVWGDQPLGAFIDRWVRLNPDQMESLICQQNTRQQNPSKQ